MLLPLHRLSVVVHLVVDVDMVTMGDEWNLALLLCSMVTPSVVVRLMGPLSEEIFLRLRHHPLVMLWEETISHPFWLK